MKIWLDDIRPAPEGWIWAKNTADFCSYKNLHALKNGQIEEISLDHDLGPESFGNGHLILTIIENLVFTEGIPKAALPVFHIHSANPVGRKNMERAIESIKRLAL